MLPQTGGLLFVGSSLMLLFYAVHKGKTFRGHGRSRGACYLGIP